MVEIFSIPHTHDQYETFIFLEFAKFFNRILGSKNIWAIA